MRNFIRGAQEIKTYLVRAYALMRPYWQSEEKVTAWILLMAILVIEGGQLYLVTKLSFATADMFDALDERRIDEIWGLMAIWFGFVTVMLFTYIIQLHVKLTLIIHWRRFLTQSVLSNYLDANIYNQVELKDYNLDNPDQRIASDLHNIAEETLTLGLGFLTNFGRVVVFSFILWSVSGPLELDFVGTGIVIPGYMFWVALIYALIGTWVAHRLAYPMTRINFERQTVEADFRYQLVRLRENAESIALLKGEASETRTLNRRFSAIWDNWMTLLIYKKRLLAFNFGLMQFASMFPYIVAMPALLSGTIALGGFLQLRGAFASVEFSLAWFALSYERLAIWKSSVDRVLTLSDALESAREDRSRSEIECRTGSQVNFEIKNLTLDLPTGVCLLEQIDASLTPGQHVIVTGPSGSGKSTLFRALSGLWVWGKGEIETPNGKTMFLPQQPYLPIATLRDALMYPNSADSITDSEVKDAMYHCQLDKFVDRLDEHADWSRIMSGGEKQRLSLVRALLSRPDWLFLDESTSALDAQSEAAIYTTLKSELPNTTLVSIAHRESLKKYHELEIAIDQPNRTISINELQMA